MQNIKRPTVKLLTYPAVDHKYQSLMIGTLFCCLVYFFSVFNSVAYADLLPPGGVNSTAGSTQLTTSNYQPAQGQHLFAVQEYEVPYSPNVLDPPPLQTCINTLCPVGLSANVVCLENYQDSSMPNSPANSCPIANVTVYNNNPGDIHNNQAWCNGQAGYAISITAFSTYVANKTCQIGSGDNTPKTHISCYLYCVYLNQTISH